MTGPKTVFPLGGGRRAPCRQRYTRGVFLALFCLAPALAQAQGISGSMEPLPGADADFSPYAPGPAPDTAFTADTEISPEDLRTDPADGAPPALAETEALRRRKIEPDDNPFDPIGIRAGAFLLKPSIETYGGYE